MQLINGFEKKRKKRGRLFPGAVSPPTPPAYFGFCGWQKHRIIGIVLRTLAQERGRSYAQEGLRAKVVAAFGLRGPNIRECVNKATGPFGGLKTTNDSMIGNREL